MTDEEFVWHPEKKAESIKLFDIAEVIKKAMGVSAALFAITGDGPVPEVLAKRGLCTGQSLYIRDGFIEVHYDTRVEFWNYELTQLLYVSDLEDEE